MAQGIEIFGRRATTVDVPEPREPRRRAPLLGIGALALAVVTAVLTGVGVSTAASGDEPLAVVFAVGAIGGSILSFLLAALALVTGRGRGAAATALVLAIAANPWILLKILEFSSAFVG